MNILFTICGRAGSKGFRNKNLKTLDDVPLLYHTLAAARLYMDRHKGNRYLVAMNTDSEELAALARGQGEIEDIHFIKRKANMAGDASAKVDVVRDTYLGIKERMAADVVIDLDITSPIRRVRDLESVMETYLSGEGYDLVCSVVEARRSPYFNMVERREGVYRKICQSGFTARQQSPAVYELNASIYAYRPAFLETGTDKPILDCRFGIAVMPDCLVLDIDSQEDHTMLEYLYPYYRRMDAELASIYEIACRMKG